MVSKIWCEVRCLRCGAVALSSGWYSPELIRRLKQETKTWKHDDNYSVICPDCSETIEQLKRCN